MKIIYQPLKPIIINQAFGANEMCYPITGERKVIKCDGNNPPKGYRSLYGAGGHGGVDLRAKHGQEVYCVQGGTVYFIDTNPRSGLDVRIETEIKGRKIRHIYEHLKGYVYKVGDRVETGQVIGFADNTGWSSGDHLHFQVEEYIKGRWVRIDPMPIMYDKCAVDILAIKNTIKFIAQRLAKLSDNIASYLRK